MELLFDNANIETLKEMSQIYPFSGVTSNPSIIKAEGKIDFYNHFKTIRSIIGEDRSLHIQVVCDKADDMLKEAYNVLEGIDKKVYIKVPVTEEGLKVIRRLKAEGLNVTATAIYTSMQGLLAISYGADYIAPYFNRIETMGDNPCQVISTFRKDIDDNHSKTKILAASFHETVQVEQAINAGAQSITIQPKLLKAWMGLDCISKAVKDFAADWKNYQGKDNLL